MFFENWKFFVPLTHIFFSLPTGLDLLSHSLNISFSSHIKYLICVLYCVRPKDHSTTSFDQQLSFVCPKNAFSEFLRLLSSDISGYPSQCELDFNSIFEPISMCCKHATQTQEIAASGKSSARIESDRWKIPIDAHSHFSCVRVNKPWSNRFSPHWV